LNKIVSTKRTSAIYLIIVLGSGTISFMYPSFIIGAQAESDYNDESDKENNKLNRMEDNDEESDNDELKNDDNNSYEDNKDEIKEASYGSDGNNNYYKTKDSNSVFVKKLKCNNINVNLN
jgi:hypothetical protein